MMMIDGNKYEIATIPQEYIDCVRNICTRDGVYYEDEFEARLNWLCENIQCFCFDFCTEENLECEIKKILDEYALDIVIDDIFHRMVVTAC
jgi:hypothetical protein